MNGFSQQLRRCWHDEGGMQVAERLAALVVVLALLGALALTFGGQGSAVGESATTTLVRLINGAAGQPTTGQSGAGLPASGALEVDQIGAGVLALPTTMASQPAEGSGFWQAALTAFIATMIVGVVLAAVLFVISLFSPEIALILGVTLLVVGLIAAITNRAQQFAAQGVPWYAYPLLVPLAASDLVGLTGVIEGLIGRDLVTGAALSESEAGERLGSGLAGLVLTIATTALGRTSTVRGAAGRLRTRITTPISRSQVAAEKYAAEILSGPGKNPRTVSAAVDGRTGKIYTAHSGKPWPAEAEIHPELRSLMPKVSLERWPVKNCAEFHVLNKALHDGAQLADLEMYTLQLLSKKAAVRTKPFGRCFNCVLSTAGVKVRSDPWWYGLKKIGAQIKLWYKQHWPQQLQP